MAVNDVLRTHRVQQLLAASTSYLNQQAREQGQGRSQAPPGQRQGQGQGQRQGPGQPRAQARFFGGAFTDAYEQGFVNVNIDVDNSELVYNDDDDAGDGVYHDMGGYDGGDVDDDDDPGSFLFEGEPMNTSLPYPSLPFHSSSSPLLRPPLPSHSPHRRSLHLALFPSLPK